jgi:molecular chaperone DnaK
MVKESEKNASEDKARREKIDLKNQSESLCYQSEKQLKELGDKINKDDQTKIQDLIKKLRDAISSEDDILMKETNEKLQTELMEIGKKIYSQNPENKTNNTTNNSTSDSVIDADFSETK